PFNFLGEIFRSWDGQERTVRKIWRPEEKRADQGDPGFPVRTGQGLAGVSKGGAGGPAWKTSKEVVIFINLPRYIETPASRPRLPNRRMPQESRQHSQERHFLPR